MTCAPPRGLLRRALAACPRQRGPGQIALRADAGYFAGALARAARDEHVAFAIGAKRIAPLWRLLDGIAEDDWHDAIDMHGAQVAVADYCPDWWPAHDPAADPPGPPRPRSGLRRPAVAAAPDPAPRPAGAAVPRARQSRRDLRLLVHPDEPGRVHAGQGVAVEHWYRHRTTVENIFRDGKHGAALRHLPSGYIPGEHRLDVGGAARGQHRRVAAPAHRHHQRPGIVAGHGVRGGKAMIDTLRWRLIAVPGRLVRHAGQLILRLPPGHRLLAEILARLRALPATS